MLGEMEKLGGQRGSWVSLQTQQCRRILYDTRAYGSKMTASKLWEPC